MPPPSVILIVDDEPIGRSALLGLLAREGYQLETAPDGPTALRVAAELLPDLILLDVMLPGMDGFEVTRQLRLRPELADVPILLVTALDDKSSRLAGIEAGADDFLTKPFDRAELRARIRTITRLNRFRHLTVERQRYHRLFERAPCGLCVVDAAGQVKEANAVAQALLERWGGPDGGRALFRLLSDEQAAALRALLAAARGEPPETPRAEFAAATPAGAPVWFELAVSRFPCDDGEAFQVAVTDRTAERLLEEELRQAQKLESIGQLAGGIAHDFNNLLTVINGFSSLALNRLPQADPAREMIEQVYQAGERAAGLTRQLLAFGRKDVTAPVNLDLNALIRANETMLRRLIGEHIVVQTRLAPVGLIHADPGQIEQVLLNLAVNARDAMPEGGRLSIETQAVEEFGPEPGASGTRWVRLAVEDSGCGMPADVQGRIFEPYFTTKQLGKGTGLGLATVYGIVQRCGGRVRVASEVGRGTRFTVDFPRLDAAGAAEVAPAPGAPRVTHGTETILLAEDDAAVRSFAAAALDAAGYKVIAACDGEDALARGADHPAPIHLLLTDAVMPRLGGRELAARLTALRPTVKVLHTSGYDDDAVRQHGVRSTEAPFLPKPYTAQALLQKVREVLDQ